MKLRSARLQRLETARQLLESAADQDLRDTSPGHAPDYIGHLRVIVRQAALNGITRLLVVLYARISDPRPGKRETTGDQLRTAKKEIRLLGKEFGVSIEVIDTFAESVSGWRFKKRERPKLVKAAKVARKHDAVLVGFDVSRFVRHEDYKHIQALPTVDDFNQLMKLVDEAQLATIASPEFHEDRSRSTKRGQTKAKAKGITLGPPKKKETLKLEAERLLAEGKSKAEVSRTLKIPYRTFLRWCPK